MSGDETGETAGLTEVDLQELRRRLVSYLRRLCSDHDLVEDYAQEALLRGWRSTRFPRERDAALRWLKCAAYRLWVDRHRRRGTHLRLIGDGSTLDDPGTAGGDVREPEVRIGEHDVPWSALHGELRSAWTHVPEGYRRLIRARYEREASFHEMAAQLGTTIGSIKMRLFRGRRVLARVIAHRIRSRAHGRTSPTSKKRGRKR